MNEQEILTQNTTVEEDYLDTIQKLKESTVSLDEYNRLKHDHKKLLNTVLEGGSVDVAATAPKRKASEIRTELFSDDADNFTNLKFVETALELRNAVLDEGGIDPFVPVGQRISATDEDYEKAQKVADALQSCVDIAAGDEGVFIRELERITVDNAPMTVRNRQGRR